MIKVNGLCLKEDFYCYFLDCCKLNNINENNLSLDEFKGLINEFKEIWRFNKQK